jgi:hypothetical protein
MKNRLSVQTNAEPQKEWVIPKLKKIDIETITAVGGGPNNDGFDGS